MSETYLQVENYKLLKKLGEGGYSKVYLGHSLDAPDSPVAVKILKSLKGKEVEVLEEEVSSIKQLDHPGIIKLIEYGSNTKILKQPIGKSKTCSYIVLELAAGGEVFDFVAETGCFSEPVARYYFHQMLESLEYLHHQGIAHRDLKPENVMLDGDFHVKLADFGFCTDKSVSETRKGTTGYMAPEIELGQEYSAPAADLFALGVILFIMRGGHPPFVSASIEDQYYKCVIANRLDKFWKSHGQQKEEGTRYYGPDFMSFISGLIQFDQCARLTLPEIRAHPWFNGPIPTREEIEEEFAQRKEMLNQTSDAACPEADVNIFEVAGAAHKGEDDDLDLTKLVEGKWYQGPGTTRFFSTTALQELFTILIEFGTKKGEVKFSKSSYKITITHFEEGGVTLRMVGEILKVGEDKHCLEFRKKEGPKKEYHELFKQCKAFFGGHVNATA